MKPNKKRERKGKSGPVPISRDGHQEPELGHVPIPDKIVMRPLSEIRPSRENDLLYSPVNSADPSIQELAQSIREKGVLEPLVVSLDGAIISGHRRYAACRIAGLAEVPVRVEKVHSTDPAFLKLLREHNRQRVKSLDEVAREAVLDCDPKEAHDELLVYRQMASDEAVAGVEPITLADQRRRSTISEAKGPFLYAVKDVLEEAKAFWPLTDRQIHYRLLNDPPLIHASKPASGYRNDLKSYKALCDLLTRARLEWEIPFHAIDDPTRAVSVWKRWPGTGPYLRKSLVGFLRDFRRDYLQSQPNTSKLSARNSPCKTLSSPWPASSGSPLPWGGAFAVCRHENGCATASSSLARNSLCCWW